MNVTFFIVPSPPDVDFEEPWSILATAGNLVFAAGCAAPFSPKADGSEVEIPCGFSVWTLIETIQNEGDPCARGSGIRSPSGSLSASKVRSQRGNQHPLA